MVRYWILTMKTTKTTTIEYSVEEFKALLKEKLSQDEEFRGKEMNIRFVIEEVGGDPLDRYPGWDEVTKVRIELKS